jgi:hypothetical protein
MDSFSQDFRIISYHLIAPKIVHVSSEGGAEGIRPSALKRNNFQFPNWKLLAVLNDPESRWPVH